MIKTRLESKVIILDRLQPLSLVEVLNKYWIKKNVVLKKIMGKKKFGLKKNWVTKKFLGPEFFFENYFGSKKCWVLK